VRRYSDIDEVIARANHTDFGLGGSVWSSDRDRAFEVARGVHPGDDDQHGEMRTPVRRLQL